MHLGQISQIEISTFSVSTIFQHLNDTKMAADRYFLADLFQIFKDPVRHFWRNTFLRKSDLNYRSFTKIRCLEMHFINVDFHTTNALFCEKMTCHVKKKGI